MIVSFIYTSHEGFLLEHKPVGDLEANLPSLRIASRNEGMQQSIYLFVCLLDSPLFAVIPEILIA